MNAQRSERHAPWILIDIETEKDYWRECFQSMPRASQYHSFERYWPLLSAVYDTYINHPGCDSDEAQYWYAHSIQVCSSGLSPVQASEVFSLVWGRITGQRLRAASALRGERPAAVFHAQ